MLTTSEAAEALRITQRRVVELIHAGELKAQKFGKQWAIDEESVQQRIASAPSSGRPAYGEKDRRKIRHYTLMFRNEEVANIVFRDTDKTVQKVQPLDAIEAAPVGACVGPANITPIQLTAWLSARYIPKNRIGVQELLKRAGLESTSDLMFQTFGLNLTDQYWFRPDGITLKWEDINFFDNAYVGDEDATGPGSGTPGMLPKWWERRRGKNFLIKGSSMGEREPFAEVLATRMYSRLLQNSDFVKYSLEHINGHPYSVCESFVASNMQLVTLRDVFACFDRPSEEPYDFKKYVDICNSLGVEDAGIAISKMLICDYLTANLDRHDMNLGLLRNADTLEFERVVPIFDNGRSFYFDAMRESDFGNVPYFHKSHPFSEYPSVQLSTATDFSWFEEDALDGFENDIKEVLSENDLLPMWLPEKAAEQFNVQLSRVLEAKQERR